jgi:general secretion pathway protein I
VTPRVPRGFTLLEILIAVAVLAIVAVVVLGRTGDALEQAARIEERTLATWVAENALTAVRLVPVGEGRALPSGRTTEQQRLGGRDWRIELEYVDTSLPTFKRVDVRVFAAGAPADAAPAARLVGFVGAER